MTHMIKSKEGIKYKVKAQWATEDKMRDVLKLREHPACIKFVCVCVCFICPSSWVIFV